VSLENSEALSQIGGCLGGKFGVIGTEAEEWHYEGVDEDIDLGGGEV